MEKSFSKHNRKNKFLLTLVIILVISLSILSGCGNGNNNDSKTNSTTIVASNPVTSEADEFIDESPITFDSVTIGEYLTFGTFEQDNDTSNGKEDIEWLVLDVKDDKALVISKHGLVAMPFNETYEATTWENCTLREWLNSDFINTAFTAGVKSQITETLVVAEDNENWGTDGGNDTNDRVFILSISEAELYFSADSDRTCKPTAYAVAQGAHEFEYESSIHKEALSSCDGNGWWWLRTPYAEQDEASAVGTDGSVSDGGSTVSRSYGVVRPAFWINITP